MRSLFIPLLLLTFSFQTSASCVPAYQNAIEKIDNQGSYQEEVAELYDFEQYVIFTGSKAKAVATYPLMFLGATITSVTFIPAFRIARAKDKNYYLKMLELLTTDSSRLQSELYQAVSKKIKIETDEFNKVLSTYKLNHLLCKSENAIKLSEEGKKYLESVGVNNFLELKYEMGEEEYENFLRNKSNFTITSIKYPLSKAEIEDSLINYLSI